MRRAFTLIELLVVVAIIALLIAILLPALSSARLQAQIIQNSTHHRGLHQAFVTFGHDNDTLYPGLELSGSTVSLIPGKIKGVPTSASQVDGSWPATRFALVVVGGYVPPEYVINPADPYPREAWTFGRTGLDSDGTPFDWRNMSYAVEEWVGGGNGINKHKVATANTEDMGVQTPVIADRIIDVINDNYGNPDAYIGVYSSSPGQFITSLAWNDGHTTISRSPLVDTKFGPYRNTDDNIYQRGNIDASVVTTPTPKASAGNVNSKFAYRTPLSHQSPEDEANPQ